MKNVGKKINKTFWQISDTMTKTLRSQMSSGIELSGNMFPYSIRYMIEWLLVNNVLHGRLNLDCFAQGAQNKTKKTQWQRNIAPDGPFSVRFSQTDDIWPTNFDRFSTTGNNSSCGNGSLCSVNRRLTDSFQLSETVVRRQTTVGPGRLIRPNRLPTIFWMSASCLGALLKLQGANAIYWIKF